MKFLKQYWLVFSILILTSALVLIRTFSPDNFRYDAVKWAEPSALGSNILFSDQIPALSGKKLLINLGYGSAPDKHLQVITVRMKPDSILEKANIRIIRRNRGPVILFSEENSVTARIWMVLSEMGLKNIYILSDKQDNQTPQTKNQTDTDSSPSHRDKDFL
jgi:hypothetical protein